jgi:hypothetical protein
VIVVRECVLGTLLMLCSLIGSVRSTGGAIAIAIYGTIIRDKATSDIVPRVAAAAVEAGLAPSEVPSFVRKFHIFLRKVRVC